MFVPKLIPEETKQRARHMRLDGISIDRIAAKLDISKSTVSLLVRDIPLTHPQRALLAGHECPGSKRRLGQIRRSEIARGDGDRPSSWVARSRSSTTPTTTQA